MIRSLLYYRRVYFAVLLAVAVTTAVLTGALLVGDSLRGTLRSQVLDRLGRIHQVIVAQHFFREQLAVKLKGAPAIILTGNARSDSGMRASQIQLMGVEERFTDLFDNVSQLSGSLAEQSGQTMPSVAINQTLRKELDVETGDQVVLSFEKQSEVNRESFLGNREASEMINTLRLTVAAVLPDSGPGAFTLHPNQNAPRNAYLSLSTLQSALQQEGRVNAILIPGEAGLKDLQRSWDLADAGLQIRRYGDVLSLESNAILISDTISKAVDSASQNLRVSPQRVFTYLANTIAANGRTIPYSTIAALDSPGLQDDEILLNEWAAKDLEANERDLVEITYYIVGSGNELQTGHHSFRLNAVLPMQGVGADRTLTPAYPGMQDVEHISEWSPPFPVDLSRIRPKDEEYWNLYRAAPKAFVSLQTGQQLWKNRFGNLTSIRIPDQPELRVSFRKQLLDQLTPEGAGFTILPLKGQGLRSAEGSTDFSGLFTGFSSFLMLSAVLLTALLFRLGVEQRAREIALLLAVGFPVRKIQRRFLAEGMIVAVSGSLLGVAGGVLYARLLLYGLSTWWRGATGSSALSLHMQPQSLAIGMIASIVIVILAVWRTTRVVSKTSAATLLAGSTILLEDQRSSRIAKRTGSLAAALSVLLISVAFAQEGASGAGLFFAAGGCLLVASLASVALFLRRSRRKPLRLLARGAMVRMAARNSARNAGRSLVSVALVCCATFILVSVGANRKTAQDLQEGTGGFALIAQSDIPVVQDLNTAESRFQLGLPQKTFRDPQILPFRLLPGEDASCLNLYRPEKPRILGAPDALKHNTGFRFRSVTKRIANPWDLLDAELEPGVIPAIGDYNSVTWILHLGLNKDLTIRDESGNSLQLRFVALLENSIFQSEVLISDNNFTRYFPSRSGYSYFLVRAEPPIQNRIAEALENTLEPFGFDVLSAADRIAGYQSVENAYLSTFQALGGLGLLLGTLGLAILLIRNTTERRGELATLEAIGYSKSRIRLLILVESLLLTATGIMTGTVSAFLAAAPHLLANPRAFPWLSLVFVLALVFLTAAFASTLAARAVMRQPLLPALKTAW